MIINPVSAIVTEYNRQIDVIDRMYVLNGKFTTTEAWYEYIYNDYNHGVLNCADIYIYIDI